MVSFLAVTIEEVEFVSLQILETPSFMRLE